MIDPIQGLGPSRSVELVEAFNQSGVMAGAGHAAPSDVAQFELAMADVPGATATDAAEVTHKAAGPAEGHMLVAQADPWVTTAPATTEAAPTPETMGDRLLGLVTDVRDAQSVMQENMANNQDLSMENPREMLQSMAQVFGVSMTIHLVSDGVSSLVNKLDGLLKSG